jgi:hypothetical protein
MARSEETAMPVMPGKEAHPHEIPPAPRFYPVEYPVPPVFHPELGYLCPSASLLRKLRSGALTALAGLAIAASVALAFAPRAATDKGPRVAAVPVLSASVPVEAAAPAVAGAPALPPNREVLPAAARAQVDCDDFLVAFRAAHCREKARSARTAWAQARKLATVAIGRAEAEPDPPKAASDTAPAVGTTTAAAAADAGTIEAAATDAAARTKPKQPARTVHKERRPREAARLDSANAMARGGYWGGYGGGGVMPYRFGGTDWARSW